jgi:2-keto-4-pentenoate hydratase/2-oxohepta-3-ene-1,7-dioic acid hydratase in catechol pathway
VKLVTFDRTAGLTPGLLLSDGIIDIPAAASLLAGSGHVPEGTSKEMFASVLDIIESGEPALEMIKQISADPKKFTQATVPLTAVKLHAPLPKTRKNIFCVGRNYVDHVTEGYKARKLGIKLPEHPQFFSKPATTIIGAEDEIPFDSDVTAKMDYEVELGVVIGVGGKNISEADALDHIFGYTIINDITARDL